MFSYLDQEVTYMGREKNSINEKTLFSSKLSLCFYIKNTTLKWQELCKELEKVYNCFSPKTEVHVYF